MVVIIYLVTMLACTLQGAGDQILYSRQGSFWNKINEHFILRTETVLWGFSILAGITLGWWYKEWQIILPKAVCYTIGSWASFSFFHNGGYGVAKYFQEGRRPLLKGWKHHSSTDTARVKFDFANRFWLFVFGLVTILIAQFLLR